MSNWKDFKYSLDSKLHVEDEVELKLSFSQLADRHL